MKKAQHLRNTTTKPLNQNRMKNELKVMGYYINSTREDQCVQIKDLKRGIVWYEVIRQSDVNTIKEFKIAKDESVIEQIKERIELARVYYNNLIQEL